MPPLKLLSPRHWLSWIGLGAIWLVARLPFRPLVALGHLLGKITVRLPGSRRRVAKRNIEVCFPQLDAAAHEALLRASLANLGMMLVEFSFGWFGSMRAVQRVPVTFTGMEHLERCRAQGRGVLLVGAHFSHLELCARLVSQRIRIAGMYRIMDDEVIERAVLRARLVYGDRMFNKDDLRRTVKYLKAGGTIWYAPDQDMRGKDNVFVAFFGLQAATITATHHLARLSGAAVIPFFHHRRADDSGYEIRLAEPLENFPSDDVVADTARVNKTIEAMVREAPQQYLWIHKRFKQRPPGEQAPY